MLAMTLFSGWVMAAAPSADAEQERQSWEKTAKELDLHGLRYRQIETGELDQILKRLETANADLLKNDIGTMLGQGMSLFRASGLASLQGGGESCIMEKDGCYRSKSVLSFSADAPLLGLFGASAAPLATLACLPADSAVVLGGRWQFQELLKVLEQAGATKSAAAMLLSQHQAWSGLSPADLGRPMELSLALTLNDTTRLRVGKALYPGVGLLLVADLADNALAAKLAGHLRKTLTPQTTDGAQIFTLPENASWQSLGWKPVLAVAGRRVTLGSDATLVKSSLAGTAGLTTSPAWQKLSAGMPAAINFCAYVSSDASETVAYWCRKNLQQQSFRRGGYYEPSRDHSMSIPLPYQVGVQMAEDAHLDRDFTGLAFGVCRERQLLCQLRSNRPASSEWVPFLQGGVAGLLLAAPLLQGSVGLEGAELISGNDKAERDLSKTNQQRLKQLGLICQSYFSDGTTTKMPDDLMSIGFGPNDLKGGDGKPFLLLFSSGANWASLNDPLIPLALSAPRASGCEIVFGDGHVERLAGKFSKPSDVVRSLREKHKDDKLATILFDDLIKNLTNKGQ